MQAFYISTIFAAICLFSEAPASSEELAIKAIGFQMAVEVARHFNTAIRWSFKVELDLVAMKRLFLYAELPGERDAYTQEEPNSKSTYKGEIEFKNVEMRYAPHLKPAVRGLTFKINAGERVAVVGRTGAGKSSLFQLLQGFRDCSQGQILIDGVSISNMSKDTLRKSMNIVLQNPYIDENESVRTNLQGQMFDKVSSGQVVFTDQQLLDALEKASLKGVSLEEKANKLSGGQV